MGNKKYTKYSDYSKNNETVKEPKEEWAVTEENDGVHVRPTVDREIIDTPVEKIISYEELKELNNSVESDQNDEIELDETNVSGVVYNCSKLYVRKDPNKNSDHLCILDVGTEVTVDKEKSTSTFYKVTTISNGVLIEGYCVKEFIEIK